LEPRKYTVEGGDAQPARSEYEDGTKKAHKTGPVAPAPGATDQAIAEYTKWLAIFTAFLVLATIGLFVSGERTVDVARQSANAAKDSADAAKKPPIYQNKR
jgi:hypothetical protein